MAKVIDINLTGAFIGSREAVKHFRKEDKKVLLLILQVFMILFHGQIMFTMLPSKGGLKLMMETMSMEYAQYGIRINNISLELLLLNILKKNSLIKNS